MEQHVTSWKIFLSPPEMSEVERARLIEAFDSGWIAPAGPDLDAFEHELAAYTGVSSAVCLSSGTAALHLALMAVGVGAGDEVLIPTTTFAAPAFATTYLGAKPCFLDVDETWQLDPDQLADELQLRAISGRLPAAVIAVNLYGAVTDLETIAELCQRYEVPLVEDGAESLGATIGARHAGTFGRVAALSFNGNKIVTTGGGGALLSDDQRILSRARYLATQARQPVLHYEHRDIGYNYRLSNLNAAVGRGQLATLDRRIDRRATIRSWYRERLLPGAGFTFQPSLVGSRPNYWLTAIEIDPQRVHCGLPEILAALHAAGIEARPGFRPMHLQPVFANAPMRSTGVSDRLAANSLCLPSGSALTESDVDWICEVLLGAADLS